MNAIQREFLGFLVAILRAAFELGLYLVAGVALTMAAVFAVLMVSAWLTPPHGG